MTRMFLLAGAAALALAMPAAAEKGGKGGGHGQGGGNSHAAKVDHGGGKGRSAKPDKAQRQVARADRRSDDRRFEDRGRGRKTERQADRRSFERARGRSDDRRVFADDRRGRDLIRRDRSRGRGDAPRFADFDNGCPPGLARKNNGCLPPGQAKKIFGLGDRVSPSWFASSALPLGYRNLYYDTPAYYYRYDNAGNIYRVDARNNMISGLIPLMGGDFFAVGQPIPAGFDAYNLPGQYRDVWHDSDDAWYRYDDNAIYQVDPRSGTIESIVALLAGGLEVGEPLPAGYDAYNLPLDYRDDYVDGDDYLYRYGDGNIYQVDAETQIIKAIVEMLV